MLILIAGLVVFFGVHSVRMVAPGFRDAQLAANERRWKGAYAIASFVGLALIIWGWIVFRPEAPELYAPPDWGPHATPAFVLAGFILAASANMPAGYIKRWVKHPMLTGVFLWAIGHLLANGDLASVLLFGAFGLYTLVNRVAVMGRAVVVPAQVVPRSDFIAIGAGLVLFGFFALALHGLLFGVPPFA